MATHGIFSGNSVEIVKDNSDFIQKIVVSNTVPQSANEAFLPKHLHVLDISGNFLQGVKVNSGKSLSSKIGRNQCLY